MMLDVIVALCIFVQRGKDRFGRSFVSLGSLLSSYGAAIAPRSQLLLAHGKNQKYTTRETLSLCVRTLTRPAARLTSAAAESLALESVADSNARDSERS